VLHEGERGALGAVEAARGRGRRCRRCRHCTGLCCSLCTGRTKCAQRRKTPSTPQGAAHCSRPHSTGRRPWRGSGRRCGWRPAAGIGTSQGGRITAGSRRDHGVITAGSRRGLRRGGAAGVMVVKPCRRTAERLLEATGRIASYDGSDQVGRVGSTGRVCNGSGRGDGLLRRRSGVPVACLWRPQETRLLRRVGSGRRHS
jgi:hypothetical protein